MRLVEDGRRKDSKNERVGTGRGGGCWGPVSGGILQRVQRDKPEMKIRGLAGIDHEADIPAKADIAEKEARISGTDGHKVWPADNSQAPAEGTQAPDTGVGGKQSPLPTLRRSKEVGWLLKRGRRCAKQYVAVTVAPAPDGRAACVIVVGRKVGKPVKRSRARRMIREALRQVRWQLKPRWIAVVARPGCGEAGFWQVAQEIWGCLRELGAIEDGRAAEAEGE